MVESSQTSGKKKKWVIPVVILAIVLVAGVVTAVVIANRAGGDKSITVNYTVEVSQSCGEFNFSGYDDIPYADVEVIDGSGNLLGFGSLDGGSPSGYSCTFAAVFEVRKSSDGVYRVTAGNTNRGYLNYTEDKVADGNLFVFASLG